MANPKKPGARKRVKQGDVRTLVRIDNPDDAEIAVPLGEGDNDTLVQIDNPDDAEFPPHHQRQHQPQQRPPL